MADIVVDVTKKTFASMIAEKGLDLGDTLYVAGYTRVAAENARCAECGQRMHWRDQVQPKVTGPFEIVGIEIVTVEDIGVRFVYADDDDNGGFASAKATHCFRTAEEAMTEAKGLVSEIVGRSFMAAAAGGTT